LVVTPVDSVQELIRTLTLKTCAAENSHLAILIEPSSTNRAISQVKIITRTVFEILWDRHLANNPAKAEEFYNLFIRNEFLSAAAEWILRSEMHWSLRQGRTVQVSPIRSSRAGGLNLIYNDYRTGEKRKREDSEPFELPPSGEHPFRKKDKLEVGRRYHPESSTLPAVDHPASSCD